MPMFLRWRRPRNSKENTHYRKYSEEREREGQITWFGSSKTSIKATHNMKMLSNLVAIFSALKLGDKSKVHTAAQRERLRLWEICGRVE